MTQVSNTLFERVKRTMEQKETLQYNCKPARCLRGECSMDECPVEDWIEDLKATIESIPQKTVEEEAEIFHALSDPIRIRIIRLLAIKGELCSCEIQAAIGEKQPITSYHLNLLKKNGILKAEKRGKWTYYRISSPEIISLIEKADKINSIDPIPL